MMKMELKARYQTMGEVVTDLEDYQVTVDPAAAEARTSPGSTRTRPRSRTRRIEPAADEQLLAEERAEVLDARPA